MNKKALLLDLLLIAFISCQSAPNDKQRLSNGVDSIQRSSNEQNIIKNIDVISLKDDYIKGSIHIYNEDGTVWKSFEFLDTFSDSEIAPFALKSDNKILIFRVVGVNKGHYSIVVNENKRLVKYFKPGNQYFLYETWQQSILKAFSVDFDSEKNPLKTEPTSKAIELPFKDQFYYPVSIKGDWLEVKDEDDKISWIKWRDEKGSLLVGIYYDA